MNSLILDVPNTYKPTFLKGLDKYIKSKKKKKCVQVYFYKCIVTNTFAGITVLML